MVIKLNRTPIAVTPNTAESNLSKLNRCMARWDLDKCKDILVFGE